MTFFHFVFCRDYFGCSLTDRVVEMQTHPERRKMKSELVRREERIKRVVGIKRSSRSKGLRPPSGDS